MFGISVFLNPKEKQWWDQRELEVNFFPNLSQVFACKEVLRPIDTLPPKQCWMLIAKKEHGCKPAV